MRFPARAGVVALHLAAFVLTVALSETVLGGPESASSAGPSVQASTPVPAAAPELPPAGSAADDAKRTPQELQALVLHDEARRLYVEGHYRAAIDKLERALELDPDEKDLHYITAFVAEKLGELEVALEHYRACLGLESNEGELMRLSIIIDRIEGAQQYAGLRALPASTRAPVVPPVGDERVSQAVDFGPWPYVSASVAGASLLVGTIMGVHALATDPGSDLRTDQSTPVHQLQEDARTAHTSAIAADIALSVAGVTGALALVLIIVEQVHRADQSEGRRASALVAGLRGGHWGLRF